MSARRKPTPSYLLHRQSGRGRAVWTDSTGTRQQKLLPGPFDSQESRTAFARLQLELETSPTAAVTDTKHLSVAEVLHAFVEHAERYYRTPDGKPTSEVKEIKLSIRPVRELYGHILAAEFGPRSLAAVRHHMIGLGWCRSLINKRTDRLKRAFKWAVAEELVTPSVYDAPGCHFRPPLRANRSEGKQTRQAGFRRGREGDTAAPAPSHPRDGGTHAVHRHAASRGMLDDAERHRPHWEDLELPP